LAPKACREGFRGLYGRPPRWLQELTLAPGDGKVLAQLARTDRVVLDDFATAPLTEAGRRDRLEVLEDRYDVRSTLITRPALADAILDRLVRHAYRLPWKGDSMRRQRASWTPSEPSEASSVTRVAPSGDHFARTD
jgi:DNA replication protein DnaC